MKKYNLPDIFFLPLEEEDIITTSTSSPSEDGEIDVGGNDKWGDW